MQKNLPCALCGALMWRGKTSLPEGLATCQPCRREKPGGAKGCKRYECADCGIRVECRSQRCRPCQAKAQRVRPDEDHRVKRRHREQSAPGLTRYQREQLLARWKKQGRTCTYCASLVETIDHVLPLVRGGTNYEGNLTPCCRSCNGSKGGLMVAEWRTGRRCGPAPGVGWEIQVAATQAEAAQAIKANEHQRMSMLLDGICR